MSKTILITGAASGLGRGIAFGLAKAGERVIAGCQIWPQAPRASVPALNSEFNATTTMSVI
ncbi:SDR family NAD(P)-dependent oxidoreductase (plasmid) [Agrobacterium tumefaciens]|uniref:SDR family NAD(P)-dependent oxidoreductase n=1 Tax=Agrobacterium tumefaciens TaxID=358 RepID=UPI001BB57BAD|nr:SDR family NAD(P)-dependent oxidoreductase [Agrobacterium tumefaciens]